MAPAIVLSVLLTRTAEAEACGLCGCSLAPPGDISFSAIGWDLPQPGTLRLSLENRESFHTTTPHANVLETTFESRTSLFLAWTPFRVVTLQWLVPAVYRTVESSDGIGAARAFGLGDSDLSARFQVFGGGSGTTRHGIFLSAGVKMPFAMNYRGPDGTPLGHAAQIGTGSWDPIASASYVGAFDRFSFFAIESLRFTTEGRGGWRAGSAFISTLALRYSLGDSLALLLSADGIYASADRLSGARIADTGGFLAYVTPSALMQLAPTTMLRVALQIPVAYVNAGTQTESVAFLVSLVFTHIPEPEAVPATSSSPMI
ncbi:MAG: hypothetical protein IPK60_10790 [Sandaracinaceae bacterium]|nr:hypothetical protein [Sandaracinaceae bacterium]